MSEQRPAYQNRISYHTTLLGAFATLSTVLLLLGDLSTREAIATRLADDMQATLNQVVPAGLYDNRLVENTIRLPYQGKEINVYRGTRQGQVTALAYRVTDQGYSGEIVLMMGVDDHGQVLGVRVLSHTETPGLGDKIEVAKSDWITHFNGLSTDNTPETMWAVKKDGGRFDQFSGATITPRAVVRAVKSGLVFFHQHEARLLAATPTAGVGDAAHAAVKEQQP